MTIELDAVKLFSALIFGSLLGAFYFGGLWWTVHKVVNANVSPLWFTPSLLIRTGLTVAGFYAVANGQWTRLIACLLGFIVVRIFAAQKARKSGDAKRRSADAP